MEPTVDLVQPGSGRPHPIYVLLALCLVAIGLGAAGCVRMQGICTNGSATDCELVISDFKIDNPRFEFPSRQPVIQGQDFWLRDGDNLNAAWDSFVLFIAAPGTMCTASSAAFSMSCERCDFIFPREQDCPSHFDLNVGAPPLTVTAYPGFTSDSASAVNLGNITSGLSSRSFSFTPRTNATVQLSTPINDRGKLAEAKVFVISNGTTESVSYQLEPLPQNVPDVTFFSGAVPRTPVLADNFSQNLSIGKVRLLKGKPDADPSSAKLQLKDVSLVRPSRIVFIPDYQGDSVFAHDGTRCYGNPNTDDGDLDLTRCRVSPGGSGSPLNATPAYLGFAPQSTLTWVAEFRASEGGIAPTLQSGEVLAIEFAIQ